MTNTIGLTIGAVEPIGDWAALKKSLAAWLNRDDFTSLQLTEFIALAESRFNRVLRHPEMETISTATLGAGNNDLPSDFLAMKSLYLDSYGLKGMTPTGLIDEYGTAAGTPCAYTLMGSNPRKIRLGPQPASNVTLTMVYYAKIVNVDENNSDNWLLNEHPDLYLYGALLAAEAFLVNDSRLPLWKAAYDEALGELINAGNRDRYGSGPLVAPSLVRAVRGVNA